MNNNTKPLHKIKQGRVSAAVWANESKRGLFHNVTITRSYRTEDGAYKDTASFSHDDLFDVVKAANEALDWLSKRVKEAKGETVQS